MKPFAIFAVAASALDLTTLALLQNGQNGFAKVSSLIILIGHSATYFWLAQNWFKNPLTMLALTGNKNLDSETYMMMNALSGKGLDFNDPIIMAALLDGGLNENLSKLMLFSGNLNFGQNPLLAMSILKGDNTSELSKLALLNGNNPNGLNNMLGLEGYSGFGKK